MKAAASEGHPAFINIPGPHVADALLTLEIICGDALHGGLPPVYIPSKIVYHRLC